MGKLALDAQVGVGVLCPRLLLLLVEVVEEDADLVVPLLDQHVQPLDLLLALRVALPLALRVVVAALFHLLALLGLDGKRLRHAGDDRGPPSLLLLEVLEEGLEVVEALVDEEAVREHQGLGGVVGVDEVLHHQVAALNVLPGQVVLLLAALQHRDLRLELSHLLLEPRDDDARLHALIPTDLVLDEGDASGEAEGAEALVQVLVEGADRRNHLGLAVTT
mmetsp:Transcript_8579/g.14479  ORF Transcript_8579/g.14479 Transcript_8579/m.14479 type:complete len:220 (-) Transcript_8579:943-1602(-)